MPSVLQGDAGAQGVLSISFLLWIQVCAHGGGGTGGSLRSLPTHSRIVSRCVFVFLEYISFPSWLIPGSSVSFPWETTTWIWGSFASLHLEAGNFPIAGEVSSGNVPQRTSNTPAFPQDGRDLPTRVDPTLPTKPKGSPRAGILGIGVSYQFEPVPTVFAQWEPASDDQAKVTSGGLSLSHPMEGQWVWAAPLEVPRALGHFPHVVQAGASIQARWAGLCGLRDAAL